MYACCSKNNSNDMFSEKGTNVLMFQSWLTCFTTSASVTRRTQTRVGVDVVLADRSIRAWVADAVVEICGIY